MVSKIYKVCRCGREYRSPEGYGTHRVDCSPEDIGPGELASAALAAFLGESKRIAKFHSDKAAGFLEVARTVEEAHRDVASSETKGER